MPTPTAPPTSGLVSRKNFVSAAQLLDARPGFAAGSAAARSGSGRPMGAARTRRRRLRRPALGNGIGRTNVDPRPIRQRGRGPRKLQTCDDIGFTFSSAAGSRGAVVTMADMSTLRGP